MSLRQDIRNCAALAYYEVCQQLGEQVTFYERAAAGVLVWAMPAGGSVGEKDVLKVRSESQETEFSIPFQTNFPPANGPSISSEILDSDNIRWRIVPPIKVDSVGAVYKFQCERIKGKVV